MIYMNAGEFAGKQTWWWWWFLLNSSYGKLSKYWRVHHNSNQALWLRKKGWFRYSNQSTKIQTSSTLSYISVVNLHATIKSENCTDLKQAFYSKLEHNDSVKERAVHSRYQIIEMSIVPSGSWINVECHFCIQVFTEIPSAPGVYLLHDHIF